MILYFDTETTGLRPGQICQISYVMQSAKETVAKNMYFTVDGMEAGALMVHGLTMEKLKAFSLGQRFKDRADEIQIDFEKADLVVSHNTAFDFMFMRAELERLGKTFTYKKEFCSMKNATPLCKLSRRTGAGYKYPKLAELLEYFSISEHEVLTCGKRLFGNVFGAHDARFDTTAVYLAVNKGIKTEKVMEKLEDYL